MDYKLIWRLIYGSFRISGNWNLCFFWGEITPTQTQKRTLTHTVHKYLNISSQQKYRSPGVVNIMLPRLRTLQQMHGNPINL